MKATIDGIKVEGTPEELARFAYLASSENTFKHQTLPPVKFKIDKTLVGDQAKTDRLRKAWEKMADDIYIKAKDLQPTDDMKKSFFEKVRGRLTNSGVKVDE